MNYEVESARYERLMRQMLPQQLTVLEEIRYKIRAEIKPRAYCTVNEYSERFTQLPSEGALTGPWRSFPYMVDILNCINDPVVREVTLVSSAQIAKTQMALRMLAYIIEFMPVPVMVLLPTIDIAEKFSKTKFEPFVESTPSLRAKFGNMGRNKNNTINYKEFEGGFVLFAGANSPNNLAMHSVGVVISDDIDRIPASAGEEGDPVKLAENRTESYRKSRYFHIRMTTPTIKGVSRGERLLKSSSYNERFVPCLACGEFGVLKFDNLKWDSENDLLNNRVNNYPETVRYVCAACGHEHFEDDKMEMDRRGKWVARNPDERKHVGFWINRLYSHFSTWEDIVREYTEIDPNSEESRRVFTNTVLGETFEVEEATEIEPTGLMARVEDFMTREKPHFPLGVLILTAAVDVQVDRLELLIKGWGHGHESWDVVYQKFYGDIKSGELWTELFEFVFDTDFVREDGVTLRVRKCVVDSGYESQTVYEMCRSRYPRVIVIKGKEGMDRNILPAGPTKTDRGRTRLMMVGVDRAKELLFSRLMILRPGPGAIHFTRSFADFEYFGQLTGERKVVKSNKRNNLSIAFVKKSSGQRVEVLDLQVYNIVAIEVLYPNYQAVEQSLKRQVSLDIDSRSGSGMTGDGEDEEGKGLDSSRQVGRNDKNEEGEGLDSSRQVGRNDKIGEGEEVRRDVSRLYDDGRVPAVKSEGKRKRKRVVQRGIRGFLV